MEREQAKSAIEAVLFTMGGAVELKSLAAAIEDEPEAAKELVEEMGIPFVEEDIMIYDVVNADEAWVTTTPYCIAPVTKFNGQVIGDGTNPMFHKILKAWGDRVGKDLWSELVDAQPIRYR